jgi:hypothetical protein
MAEYTPTNQDNGGVHIYSGIPNRAFYLASVAFGGYSWEKAGQTWWKAMNSGRVPARCTFIQFADVTTDVAEELYGEEVAEIVRGAWNDVGVKRHEPAEKLIPPEPKPMAAADSDPSMKSYIRRMLAPGFPDLATRGLDPNHTVILNVLWQLEGFLRGQCSGVDSIDDVLTLTGSYDRCQALPCRA